MTGARQPTGQELPVPRPAGVDEGFTLVETMVSIFVVGVVMASLTAFFVGTLAMTNRQSGAQAASQAATDAIATIRSIKGSALTKGRDQASSHTQWITATRPVNPQPPGAAGYLIDMVETPDPDPTLPNGTGATAALPTSAVTVTLPNLVLQQNFFLGTCWQPVAGGACTPPPACFPSCTPAQSAGYVPFFRAVVAVTWPDRTCAASLCSFITSTLVSSASNDPLFNSNAAATAPTTTSPGDQSGYVNSTVSLQLSSTGGAAPTSWSFTGLPNGLVGSSSGLITGTLAGPVGIYPVTATATDAFGLTGSTTFNWAVTVVTYPTEVAADGPWAYYRGEDPVSSSATSTAKDTTANNRDGVYSGMTNGPSTYWDLDEGAGAVASDSSGAANPGTLGGGGTMWTTAGRVNQAVALNGSTNYISGTAPAVATDASFSVSAWVYLATLPSVNKAIVSQPGTRTAGFDLTYSSNKWELMLPTSDADNPGLDLVYSAANASAGTWTHLVGVYDSTAAAGQQVKLYVNAGTPTAVGHTATWKATGPLEVGRTRWNGAYGDYFPGRVDEVRTYRRALSPAEITTLYGDSPSAQYDFEENTGTTTADNSGNAHPGTLTGAGTTWTTAGHTGNAVSFGNSTNNAVTAAAAVNTDASFSVSAWAYLNGPASSTQRAVISQAGVNTNAFNLKRQSGNKWEFSMSQTDSYSPTTDLATSVADVTVNAWTHLVAEYDTSTSPQMKLYVNGVLADTGTHTKTFNATGSLLIGRSWFNNAFANPWDGMIDDVRTYRRALTTTEIGKLYNPPATAAMTAGLPGALQGVTQGLQASTAVAFNGTSNAYRAVANPGPAAFTTECWFKTNSTTGGQLIGYTADPTGLATTGTTRDRMVYLDNGNRLTFGIWWNNAARVIRSPLTYNDGAWHHVATSYGPAGLKLYVDGALVASNATYTQSANPAGAFAGYWRWGGGQLNWANANSPVNDYFTGTIDEVAIYSSQLTDQRIAAHYQANQ